MSLISRIKMKVSSPPFGTFTIFSRLPVELRLKIWRKYQSEPRIIEMQHNHDYRFISAYRLISIVPTILRICSESREEGLRIYDLLSFSNAGIVTGGTRRSCTGCKIDAYPGARAVYQRESSIEQAYINYKVDTLYVRDSALRQYEVFRQLGVIEGFADLKHIAFSYNFARSSEMYGISSGVHLKQCVRKNDGTLESLSLVYSDPGRDMGSIRKLTPLDPRVWYRPCDRPFDLSKYTSHEHLISSIKLLLEEEETGREGLPPVLQDIEIARLVAVREGKHTVVKEGWYRWATKAIMRRI